MKLLQIILIMSIIGCSKQHPEIKNTEYSNNIFSEKAIKQSKIWVPIKSYMNEYAKKSNMFALHIFNNKEKKIIQIYYILKQKDLLKHYPFYYLNIDGKTLVFYNGIEDFIIDEKIIEGLKKENNFLKLKIENDTSFMIYHPSIWELSILNDSILIYKNAEPFDYLHLKKVIPPPILPE